MSSAVTETEIYEASVVGPDDGDLRNAASVRAGFQDLANRTNWTEARVREMRGIPRTVTAVDSGTDTFTSAAHGLSDTTPVYFTSTGGSIPAGLVGGTIYYVRDSTANTFKVSATSGGSAINLTGIGSGTIYVWSVPEITAFLFVLLSGDNLWTGPNSFDQEVEFNATSPKAASFHGPVDVDDGYLLSAPRHALGGQMDSATITGTDNETISVATARVFFASTPTGNRIITLSTTSPVPVEGEEITIIRPATGAFTYEIRKAGGAAAMATMAASTFCSARFRVSESVWRLISWTAGVTAGAEA